MKLTAKLVSLWLAGALLIIGIGTYLSILSDVATFEQDLRRDADQRARRLAVFVHDIWSSSGEPRALELIERADAENHATGARMRWVWLDAQAGDPHASKASERERQDLRDGKPISYVAQMKVAIARFAQTFPSRWPALEPALELESSLDSLDRFRRNAVLRACAVAVILFIGSGLAAAFFGIVVVGRPLDRLIAKTRHIGAGELSDPLPTKGHDEFTDLSVAINRMCDQLAAARDQLEAESTARSAALEQLRHAERLTTVGQLASGMAHELGTPMHVASLRAELIMESAPSTDAAESAQVIKGQIEKMTKIIRQLLDFARRRRPRKEVIDLAGLADQTNQLVAALAQQREVQLQISRPTEPVMIEADCGQVQQVLTNLIVNAVQASSPGKSVQVRVHQGDYAPRNSVGGERRSLPYWKSGTTASGSLQSI